MKVLTVFAHHGSRSFCHAVRDRFDAGLRYAGHTNEIVDLHAIGFDPCSASVTPRTGWTPTRLAMSWRARTCESGFSKERAGPSGSSQ
jgi:hypothetical protein